MSKLFRYIKPHVWYIALTVFIKFFGTTVELFIPRLMETILDDSIPAARISGDLTMIFILGGGMILCAAIGLTGNIIANRMAAISAGRITRKIRHDLFEKLDRLSARQMDKLTVSSAVTRLTSDTYNFNNMMARMQRMGIRAPILLVGGVAMMLSMDWKLSLVLIGMLPVISLTVILVTKKTVPLHKKAQEIQDNIVRVCQENITGIRVIKALSKTEHERKRFDGVNTEHTNTTQKAATYSNITSPVANLALNLSLTAVVVLGAYRVNSGGIEPGVIVAFLQYFTQLLMATLGVTRIFIMWAQGEASAVRIAEVLDEPEDLTVLPAPEEIPEKPAHIEFKDVTFSYTGVGTNLENLSFRLEHGQSLGILGPTGSGKSTILNLLMRFYDPDAGQILIDGQDIRTIPYEQLREKFGVVFQNDFVTEGTIAHNIRFFRDLDDAALEKAAQNAQAKFIEEKEGRMEAEVVIRGNNLSGGQKQRLLIARALASDPEILILDDASSALDYQTDSNLRKALRENYRDTTTVLIAQRVSSLRHADLILVLDDGKVIGAGDHRHLMETCEEYRIIAETQMGEGKEEL